MVDEISRWQASDQARAIETRQITSLEAAVSCLHRLDQVNPQINDAAVHRMLTAHHPMLAISVLGLSGLSVATGLVEGIPIGVQLVAARFNEALCLSAGEVIESKQPVATSINPLR